MYNAHPKLSAKNIRKKCALYTEKYGKGKEGKRRREPRTKEKGRRMRREKRVEKREGCRG